MAAELLTRAFLPAGMYAAAAMRLGVIARMPVIRHVGAA